MNLASLKCAEGAVKKRKRVGRGTGSGSGKTCGRGMNGQKSRSGSKRRPWFEGGQMPIQRRLPKRGFTNIFRREYQIVNVCDLLKVKGKQINPEKMFEAKLIRNRNKLIKVLGNGEIKQALEVKAHVFSSSAAEMIEKAGGKAIKL